MNNANMVTPTPACIQALLEELPPAIPLQRISEQAESQYNQMMDYLPERQAFEQGDYARADALLKYTSREIDGAKFCPHAEVLAYRDT